MVDTCVAPSELHLKKELTALRKARLLRDPETCSSWRFPLTSDSFTAAYSFECGNGTSGNSRERKTDKLLQLSSSSGNRQKRVYLYNWRHHSNKSSESGIKLDDDDSHISVEGNVEDNSNNPHKVKTIGDTYLDGLPKVYSLSTNPETPVKRTVKKSRNTNRKKQSIKHLTVTKLPDLQSSSIGVLDSVEPSDDTEYCNSEDLQQLTQELTQKTAYRSPSASPIFSGSGCGNWSYSSRIFRSSRKEGSSQSCTPASTSSYYRQGRNTSIVESWDGTAASLDGDELDQLELQRHQGYGIPCYWSKRAKEKGYGGFYSPSLSDTLRRKGRSLFCGSQTLYSKKRSSGSNKQKYPSKPSQGLPLLANSCDGGNSSSDTASDELSTNFGELELEALSRLDGRRWSSCKSQELESTNPPEADIDTPEHRSLNQKYRPRSFDEIIGQNIVTHSLTSAVRKGRIAPAYLFQGPRGTGKTSTARIFAASLNCLSAEDKKPCWICRECTLLLTGSGSNVREVDGTDKKGIDRVRYLLKNMSAATVVPRYKVFIIDECHMLSSRMWSAFINILEEPPSHLVVIFITIDPENLPSAVVSRCQKYHFSKVKDVDIICHLRKLCSKENHDIELEALDLIALNSDGSLRDAVTMLEQLSLLGKRITSSLVNELVGVVSDEKLLDLLEIAMSSDTAETVKRSRELMDSGVDPVALMSQLAGLIMDIIAGSNQLVDSESSGVLGGRSLSDDELKRLQQALNILSDAEKQLRLSSERSTWFTAALLQLGSGHNGEFSLSSSSSSKQSSKKMNTSALQMAKNNSSAIREFSSALISRESSGYSSPNSCASYNMTKNAKLSTATLPANTHCVYRSSLDTHHVDDASSKKIVNCISPNKLAIIWRKCIQRCHSETLRQLLSSHGKLLSITETEGALVASIVFEDGNIKSRAERYLSSITNSIEIVLQHNVKVRIGLMSENVIKRPNFTQETVVASHKDNNGFLPVETKGSGSVKVSEKQRYKGLLNLPRSLGCSETMVHGTPEKGDSSLLEDQGFPVATFPMVPSDENDEAYRRKEKGQESLVQRTRKAAMDDRHLENAWLQAAGETSSGMVAHSDSMRNLVLSQNGISCENHAASVELAISSKHWEDELNHETKALRSDVQGQYKKKVCDVEGQHKKKVGGPVDQYVISPSLLHRNGFTKNIDKENLEHKSRHGCSGLFCWQTHKGKVKQGTHVQSPKTGRIRCLGSVRNRWHRKAE